MNILIVDDSRIIRSIITNILKEKNIPNAVTLEAADGSEALNILIKTKIDLFFLDWNMPKLNGVELTRAIREIDQYKSTPIIMVTSEAAKYNVLEAIKAGVSEYVVKPITSRNLLEKINKYL
jgi:two-component system chemotaxis response regulator CheY|uniref:Response regulator n=1 Tax=Gracilinema caldarium TaxID=215591 RepID=A0A7C3I366_9SPIR